MTKHAQGQTTAGRRTRTDPTTDAAVATPRTKKTIVSICGKATLQAMARAPTVRYMLVSRSLAGRVRRGRAGAVIVVPALAARIVRMYSHLVDSQTSHSAAHLWNRPHGVVA